MKIAKFQNLGRTYIGEVVDDLIYPYAWQDDMVQVIRRRVTPSHSQESFALADVKLLAPIKPSKIIGVGRNYAEHAAELGNDMPEKPLLFAKLPSSIVGPGETIRWREADAEQVDWEVELAVVIGKRAKDVPEDEALDYVFGYTVANDVSARDLQAAEPQWLRAKGLDTFCPLGPWIVTRAEIEDPQKLSLKTTVNDEVMQDSSTEHMIFSVAQLIAFASRAFTLEPGDLLLTGTPAGVGKGKEPPRFLGDGDTVTVSIAEIGEITNPCEVIKDE